MFTLHFFSLSWLSFPFMWDLGTTLWGDWFLQAKNRIFFFKFSVCMFVLAASPDLFFQLTFFFFSQANQTNKTFPRRYHWVCKYNGKRDDHEAVKERKMSNLVKNLKLVITNSLFSTGPPESQSLPRNAQSLSTVTRKSFWWWKASEVFDWCFFPHTLQYLLVWPSNC